MARQYWRVGAAANAFVAPLPKLQRKQSLRSGDDLCAFFRGTGTDIECRTLEQILLWDDQLMEVCHDYIQWLLPTDERSKFNDDAPILDAELQRIFSSDPIIQYNFRRGLLRFLGFLGLSAVCDATTLQVLQIAKAPHFPRRLLMCWKGPANHNWKRISRALRSLGLVGLETEQQALLSFIEELMVEHPGMVDEATVGHWLKEGCTRAQLVHPITPGYISALLSSHHLLASLCTQYFRKYDKNGDGVLAVDEIYDLCLLLHKSLGLPADALDEASLSVSIAEVNHTGTLTSNDFPLWFARVLRETLQKSNELKADEQIEETPEFELPMSVGYGTALLQSEALLASICKHYLKRYDANSNGCLELDEAHGLCVDLHRSLGVPADATIKEQLSASFAEIHSGDPGNSLRADQFPAWFSKTLKATLAKRIHISEA